MYHLELLHVMNRRWAGKTSYVHLAPESEYRVKHLMKAYKISLKHVPWPQIHLGVCVNLWPSNMHKTNFTQFLLDV